MVQRHCERNVNSEPQCMHVVSTYGVPEPPF
jgi:hypothetical protein